MYAELRKLNVVYLTAFHVLYKKTHKITSDTLNNIQITNIIIIITINFLTRDLVDVLA